MISTLRPKSNRNRRDGVARRAAIFSALSQSPKTVQQLADLVECCRSTAHAHLTQMEAAGKVKRAGSRLRVDCEHPQGLLPELWVAA